jgi:hypothetical protein
MIASNARILSQFEHIVTGLSVFAGLAAVQPSGCGAHGTANSSCRWASSTTCARRSRRDERHGAVHGRGQLWLAKGEGYDLPADTYVLEGKLRQVIAIIPSRRLVILRMGLTREDIGYSVADLLHAIVAARRPNR